MARIISGTEFLESVKTDIKARIKNCIIRPSVAVIEIGDNKLNEIYSRLQEELCNEVGIYYRHYKFESDATELTIINKIKELNNDDYVHGIQILLPILDKYNEKRLLNTISNSKDVDGLTDINLGRLISGRKTIISCTSLAIMDLFNIENIDLCGKEVVLVGKGRALGRSLITLLLNSGATVTICHSNTKDLKKHLLDADIVISAVGKKGLITDVKDDAIVIDLGYEVIDDKVHGDVNTAKVGKKASIISSSKDGIGTFALAEFIKNVVLCYENKK